MDKDAIGTEVDFGLGHVVLDEVPAARDRGTAARPISIVATVAYLSCC